MKTRVKRLVARNTGVRARHLAQLAATLAAVWLIGGVAAERFGGFDGALFRAHLDTASALTLLAVAACAAVSLAAIACYDLLAFRALGVDAPDRALLRAGATATGLGQALGLGLIVGGLARWRMLRDHGVSPAAAAAATALVSAGFFLGLAVVLALSVLAAPHAVAAILLVSPGDARLAAALFLVGLACVAVFAARRGRRGARVMAAQTLLAALDVAPAAFALWLLLPATPGLGFAEALVAYAAALGAGLISNLPGGAGVFEGALLASLPQVRAEPLLAAVLLHRVAFHALPFAFGLIFLGRAEIGAPRPTRPLPKPASASRIAAAIAASDRAEANLAWSGDKNFIFADAEDAFLMFGRRAGAQVSVGDPVGPRRAWPDLIARFIDGAEGEGARPLLYKIGPAAAALCRTRGLVTDLIGHEAVLDPQTFDLNIPARRQLRRKLRQAEKSGLSLDWRAPGEADLAALAPVSDAWLAARNGREAGFSMGAFTAGALARTPVIEARAEGRVVAFLTLWTSGDGREWAVDLMRAGPGAPQGAMQALIVGAVEAARDAGADRFNLCMAPLSGLGGVRRPVERLGALIFDRGGRFHDLQGLRRFKAGFAPEWRPRYAARRPGPGGALAYLAVRGLIAAPPRPAPHSGGGPVSGARASGPKYSQRRSANFRAR